MPNFFPRLTRFQARPAFLVLPVCALAAVMLSGCAAYPVQVSSPPGDVPFRSVTVSATGTAEAVPDALRVYMTVVAQAGDASSAQQEASSVSRDVVSRLRMAGVEDSALATDAITVGPAYDFSSGQQEQTGFEARQTLTATLPDIAKAGQVLDDLVAYTGDMLRIDQTSRVLSDAAQGLRDQARLVAVEQARDVAEQYAQELGFSLGPVVSVSETSSAPDWGCPGCLAATSDSRAEAGGAMPTMVEAGVTQVSVPVTVTWEIRG